MLTQRCQRHRSFLKPLKCTDALKKSASGTLSPDTMVTTSSGYSTGGSSVSTATIPSLKRSSTSIVHKQQPEQQKTKSKGFHNLITKLKSFIISPKAKLIHSSTMIPTTSREISSTNIHRQYSTPYTLSPSLIKTSNTVTLPFTYYHNSPRKCEHKQSYTIKTTNFDKISAWLDHTETTKLEEDTTNELLYIDDTQQQSISSSSFTDIDNQVVTLIMKKSPSSSIKTPKRSTSMVSTMTRPIIEAKQYDRTVSPTSSFSSSILARGMSEFMTPQKSYHQSGTNLSREQSNNLAPKSNRRRAIDFSRRRTVAGPTEQFNNNNKENVPSNHRRQQIYQFSPSTSTDMSSKKYYFHSNTPVKNEDMLMNSYGLTLLQQQQPVQQRHSVSAVVMMSQFPDNSSQKQLKRRTSIHLPQKQQQQQYTVDSLDDLLCDREVESYFYPNKQQSPTSLPQHIYINLETPSNYYQPPTYIHGTLC